MNPTSNPPSDRRSLEGQSQQQSSSFDIAAQWLEQQRQQLEQQRRQSLNQAIHGPPTNTVQFPQQGLRNQQLSGMLPSADTNLQRAYLLDVPRRQQAPQVLMDEANTNSFQHNLGHLMATAQEGGSNLDRLMAVESLAVQRRNKMEEAVRMIHLQGVIQNAFYQGDYNAGLPIPTGPFLPLHFLSPNSTSQQDIGRVPPIFHSGQIGMLPSTRQTLDSQWRGESQAKRKAEGDMDLMKEPAKKKALSVTKNSFPLPSTKRARSVTLKLRSYRAVWHELEESEMQEEIFRRRIFEGINLKG